MSLPILLIAGVTAVALLACAGTFAFLVYLGSVGPDTKVYTGNEVPRRFLDTMDEIGVLEPEERLLYFYSDAMTDIRGGFYFVSDRRVVIYSESKGEQPYLSIAFDEIEDLDLARDTSFLVDSEITLVLADGRPVAFPVSSEGDRDVRFFEEIQARVDEAP